MAAERVRRTLLMGVQWTITVGVVGGIAVVLASKGDQLRGLLALSAGTVAILAAGAFAQLMLPALVLRTLTRAFDVRVPFAEITIISIVDSTLNYLPLKGGLVATGTLLFGRHRLRPTAFASIAAGRAIVSISVCTMFGAALLLARGVIVVEALVLLALPAAIVAALGLWGRRFDGNLRNASHHHWLSRALVRAVDGVRAIFGNPRLLAAVMAFDVLRVAVGAIQLKVAFGAVSTSVDWQAAFIISSLATILGKTGIVPGGLGLREGGVAGVAALLGMSATIGLAASVVERTVTVAVTALLGIPAIVYMSRTTAWDQLTRAHVAAAEGEELASAAGSEAGASVVAGEGRAAACGIEGLAAASGSHGHGMLGGDANTPHPETIAPGLMSEAE